MRIRKDYQDHFLAGTLVGMAGAVICLSTPILSAMIAGVVVGSIKEFIYDKWLGKGTFEWMDILFTTAGATLIGVVVKILMLI